MKNEEILKMSTPQVKYHILRDLKEPRELGDDNYRRTVSDPDLYHNQIAFTSLLYLDGYKKLYLGLTAFDTDVFYQFDPETEKFESLGYPKISEKYEVKIHRSLSYDGGKFIYGATACLHDLSLRNDAPGGKIFRYNINSKEIEILGIPCPPDYIQTISLDKKRNIVYGFGYPVFKFFRFDINAKKTTDFGYIGSIIHISAIDDGGKLWGTWHQKFHNLFCYNPDSNKINFFEHGIPGATGGKMYPGAGPVDSMINGGDGFIYIGATGGSLLRLNPDNAECEYLGKPYPEDRMPAIFVGNDNLIYGCGGDEGNTYMFSYDRAKRSFTVLAQLKAADGLSCYRTHDMAMIGKNRFFIGETDNPKRAGYLWEIRI